MKKTLVPLTQAQMDLIVACLVYCESHPSHRDIEISDVREKMQFFALKDKCSEPVKTINSKKKTDYVHDGKPLKPYYDDFPDGLKETEISKEQRRLSLEKKIDEMESSTGHNFTPINGSGVLSEGIDKMEKIGERTKRKYNKSKFNPLNKFNA
jgi:hypothetical protein